MAISIKEHQLDTFTRPGNTRHAQKGDFATATGFTFDDGQPTLSPRWSADAPILISAGNSLDNVFAAFQDQLNTQPIIWIGDEGSTLYRARDYTTSAATYTGGALIAAPYTLGGQSGQNILYTDWTQLHLIASSGDVFRGPHTTTLTNIYNGGNAQIITFWNDYVYVLATTGVYRLEATTFSLIYAPDILLKPVFAIPFRGYLLIANQDAGGKLLLHQFTPENNPRLLYQLPTTQYSEATAGHCVALHQGDVFFTTRGYTTNEDGTLSITVNRFDGSVVYPVHTLRTPAGAPASIGLLSWKNELILYVLRTGVNPTHNFYVLTGNDFIPLNSITDTGTITSASVSPIGQQLVFNRMVGAVATFTVLGNGPITAASYLSSAALETGSLDLDTNQLKLLHNITVQLSTNSASVTTTIRYKIDHAATWTSAGSGTGARVTVEDLKLEFHTLDIRVEIAHTSITAPLNLDSISIVATKP